MNHYQAIILALDNLGGEGTIGQVNDWINSNYPNTWKDAGTSLADIVPMYWEAIAHRMLARNSEFLRGFHQDDIGYFKKCKVLNKEGEYS
jgi:hypothetical protein